MNTLSLSAFLFKNLQTGDIWSEVQKHFTLEEYQKFPFDILPKSWRNKPYLHTKWHDNAKLLYQCYYENGQKHGECKFWFYNGQLMHQRYYVNGQQH